MDNLVSWTYVKGPAAVQAPVQPAATGKETSTNDQLSGFFTNPLVLLFGPSVVVVIVLSFLIYKRRKAQPVNEPELVEAHLEETPPVLTGEEMPVAVEEQVAAARARLTLPNGMDLQLGGSSRNVGRGELARALGLDDLALISRKHFAIGLNGENFSVEDQGSANGTLLNGADIKGKGPVEIQDGDIIEPAGVIKLKFHTF